MADPNPTTPEIWKPVPGHKERYSVSSLGRVRIEQSDHYTDIGRIMAQATNGTGYRQVKLCKNGRYTNEPIHRLVARAFLGPCPPGHHVNHINCDPSDNRLENLEYCTPLENTRHALRNGLITRGEQRWNSKLTEEQVRYMRQRHERDGVSGKQLAEEMNICHSAVCSILRRASWKHVD